MAGPRGRFDPYNLNWEDFQKNFFRSHKEVFNHDFSWLEGYIQDMVAQAFPGSGSKNNPDGSKTRLRPDVFETHHFMIVRAQIPEEINLRKLKVFFNTNQIRLSGLGDREEVIPLPAPGRFDGCKALFKDDILEIRIPKELNEMYREIDIQYL